MGNLLFTSSTTSTNPNDNQNAISMSSPETPKSPPETTDQPKTLETTETPVQESSDPPPIDGGIEENLVNPEGETNLEGEEEEEEEGECGFCLFMKGGGCKDSFIEWEKCIEEAEKSKENIVDKCFEVTSALKQCMEAHPDYYEPILRAEKAAEAEAIQELEKEKEKEAAQESEKGKVEIHPELEKDSEEKGI